MMLPTTARSAGTVDGLVVRQAARAPDAVAVTYAGRHVTYAELVSRAGELAHRLLGRGVRPGDVIALLMDRSVSYVVSALGVLMAGGAYLPLDRRHPPDRLRWMADDARAVLLLTDGAAAQAGTPAGLPVEEVAPAAGPAPVPRRLPDVPSHPEQPAYVMYTSGSTGRPKGVVNTHRNIVDFIDDPYWHPADQARVLAYSPLGFDSSTYELWVPLARGGEAVVWDPHRFDVAELRKVVTRHEVTAAYFTTALFDTIAHEDPTALAPLRTVVTGGDVLSPGALRRIREHCPDTTVVHAYGPTETTVFCSLQTFAPPHPRDKIRLDLGRPMAHTDLYVLDAALRPVPAGETGELYVTGARLARGYLGRPGLTAERFLPDPHGAPGTRMYRTGDLATRHPDGTLTFAGRVDRQVKLRGFRIEPGEVEAALVDLPGVARAAVTVRDDLPGGRGLAAHLVPRDPPGGVDTDEVRRDLERTLPSYMVPSAFAVLPELPLTANGKVDHAALPRPDTPSEGGREPRTPLEDKLCGLFAEQLQCPPVGVDDNFFQLGGHSLLAIRLGTRIRETTGHAVAIKDLFRHPTVAGLAAHLSPDTE